ncbi:MAG: DUF3857 domain-containing protein [Candidatus Eisenbacteria bacterium]|nr:DUF3857 domain-containing protein [Candidatus Eisenbacteria bacterium]
MRRFASVLLILALAAPLAWCDQWQDVDVAELRENAPDAEEYPDASALFLKIQKLIDVDAEGAVTTRRNVLTKTLTLKGRENYANQSFYYNADREELELVKGVTIRRTGRTVEIEPDAINDVTPAFLEGATIYANVVQKVFSFPVVGKGSTMELQLLTRMEPAPDGSFSGIEYFRGEDPILDKEVVFTLPDGVTLTTAVVEGDAGFADADADFDDQAWHVRDVPGLVPEENMPPTAELYPRAVYSSYEDWQGPSAFFADVFYKHVETDGDVAARAAEITEGAADTDGIIRDVFLEVAENVRNVYLDLGLGGYEPNNASLVMENRYGDTRDKAVLLVSMLRAAGVDAWPVLVNDGPVTFVDDVPTLEQFDSILVAVRSSDGYRFLDPFLDNVHYGYLYWGRGNTGLVVMDDGSGELVEIPPFSPSENASERSIVAELDDDGAAELVANAEVSGFFDRRCRAALKDATDSEVQKFFEEATGSIGPGATDVEHFMTDLKNLLEPVRVRQTIDAPDFAVPQGDMMILRVPEFPFAFARVAVEPSLAEREFSFMLPAELVSIYEFRTRIPEGYEPIRIPEPIEVATDDAVFELACEWDREERSVVWTKRIEFLSKRVPPERYADFKAAYDRLLSPKNGLILLEKA